MDILKILILGVCLNLAPFAYAETISLKSGQSVTGNILEKTDKYIKMDVDGVHVTYYADEIKNMGPAAKVSDDDQLIQDVLESGGIKKQIDNLPGAFIASMIASCEQKNSAEMCAMMKEAAAESFKAEHFNKSVVEALELNFDKTRLAAMLEFFKTPLAKKITQEELLSESPGSLQEKNEFAKQALNNPPSEKRLALFERSDKAVHSTDLAVEISSLIAMEIYEAVKKASPARSGEDDTAAKMQMELQLRVQLRQPMKESSRISFLFDYRHISDEELDEQINFQESETGRWFTRIINKAFVDAMSQAGQEMAAKLVSIAKEKSGALQAQFKSLSNEELYKQANDLIDHYSGRYDDLQKAWVRLTVLLNRDADFAKTYVGMARVVLLRGYMINAQYDGQSIQVARQSVEKAITLDPKLAEAYRLKGYIEVYAGDLAQAKEMLEKVKTLDPDSMLNDLLEGCIARTEKRYPDALTIDQAALAKTKTDDDQWLVYKNLVDDYKFTGQKEKTKGIYLKMIELRPDYVWTKGNYALYLSFIGEWDSAIDWAQKTIAQMDYPAAHKALADAYYRKGYDLYWKKQQYNEGGPYLEKAYAEDPTIKGLNYSLGDYYRSINRLQDAVDAYRREIDIDPTNQNAQQELDRTTKAMGASK